MHIGLFALALATSVPVPPPAGAGTVTERSVAAHEAFLAGDQLGGRASATPDEAIAAAYVASEFQAFGLAAPPGMDGYLQRAVIVRQKLGRAPSLTVEGSGALQPTVLFSSGQSISGALTIAPDADPAALPSAAVVLAASKQADPLALVRAASPKHIRLLILREGDVTRKLLQGMGGTARLPTYIEGVPGRRAATVVTLPDAAVDALLGRSGMPVALALSTIQERSTTTNAIAYLEGSDANAGTLLFTAHLDHLGRREDGTIMHGANDDASGTTAVLELGRVLAAGRRPRRSILFVCYGSEEIGEYGSTYFAQHPPVPLGKIVANLEFEMIGAQDPKLPRNMLMMTGFERSNLGKELKRHGALVTGDPYPDEHFFERSDNYALALKGVVAHTVSGWALTPTYHQPSDTIANLNIPFMTTAINSLVKPIEWLANSNFVPAWNAAGMPIKAH